MITIMKVEEADRNEMNLDDQYLCSIQDLTRKDLILMMYNCKVNKLKKIALSDLEATMTYISSDYAKRFNVHFLEKSTSRIVQLSNESEMKILDYCEFLMTMKE